VRSVRGLPVSDNQTQKPLPAPQITGCWQCPPTLSFRARIRLPKLYVIMSFIIYMDYLSGGPVHANLPTLDQAQSP
jgi:hypothetical protein